MDMTGCSGGATAFVTSFGRIPMQDSDSAAPRPQPASSPATLWSLAARPAGISMTRNCPESQRMIGRCMNLATAQGPCRSQDFSSRIKPLTRVGRSALTKVTMPFGHRDVTARREADGVLSGRRELQDHTPALVSESRR